MFEVYAKDVTINGVPYRVNPLPGEKISLLFRVVREMQKHKGEDGTISSQKFLDNVSDETVAAIHELCLVSMMGSYPNEDINKMTKFVTQNMFKIFPVIVEVNMNNQA